MEPTRPASAAWARAPQARPAAATDVPVQAAAPVRPQDREAPARALPPASPAVPPRAAAGPSAAYAAGARLTAGNAEATRLLAPDQGARPAFGSSRQARTFAEDGFATLSSAVAEVNRTMALMGSLNPGAAMARAASGGEAALMAMAGALRDANTRVEVAVRRLRDAYQVSGSVTVRMSDGRIEIGSFSLSFAAADGDGVLASPLMAESGDAPEGAQELGGGQPSPPGSALDLRI